MHLAEFTIYVYSTINGHAGSRGDLEAAQNEVPTYIQYATPHVRVPGLRGLKGKGAGWSGSRRGAAGQPGRGPGGTGRGQLTRPGRGGGRGGRGRAIQSPRGVAYCSTYTARIAL